MPAKRSTVQPASSTHLRRVKEWAGVVAGDPVDLLDAERGTQWRFSAQVTNLSTGATWVEVTGGRPGDERRRSCRPEQLFPFGTVRRGVATAAPLADEPRLPLSAS